LNDQKGICSIVLKCRYDKKEYKFRGKKKCSVVHSIRERWCIVMLIRNKERRVFEFEFVDKLRKDHSIGIVVKTSKSSIKSLQNGRRRWF
jgi:hypothetical protein